MLSAQFAADVEATCRSRPRMAARVAYAIILHEAVAKNAFGTAALEGNPTPFWRVQEILAPRLQRRILEIIVEELAAERDALHVS